MDLVELGPGTGANADRRLVGARRQRDILAALDTGTINAFALHITSPN
jgi:hypothetical protein